MKFRYAYMIIGSLLTVAGLLLGDPDSGLITNLPIGGSTVAMLLILLSSVLYVAMLHISRKGLFDYVDVSALYAKALETSQGAGLFFIGLGLAMISISVVILAAVK